MGRQACGLTSSSALVWFTTFLSLGSLLDIGAGASTTDESVLIGEVGRQNNQSLLWGPYKPNLYFGVRPRIPKSVTVSLMWGRVDTYQDIQNCLFPKPCRPILVIVRD